MAAMTDTAPSPTASKTKTRPDYAREIWDNGFREECERIAMEINADKKKKVQTTKDFWMKRLKTYLRLNGPFQKYIRATYPHPEDMGWGSRYDTPAVHDGVWELLCVHFGKPISVTQEMLDKHNRHTAILEAVGSMRNDSQTKPLPPASKEVVRSLKISTPGGVADFGAAEYALMDKLQDAAHSAFGKHVYDAHKAMLYALGAFKAKTPHRQITTWSIPYPEGNNIHVQNGKGKDVFIFKFEVGEPKEKLKTPIAQALFGSPDDTTSLLAFCDAQLQLLKPKHQLAAYYEAIKKRLLADGGSNAPAENRYCACGCGEALTGNGKMKFVNGTHRKRAWAQNKT